MDKTKIEWADATWNPVTGCLHGCEYCYAARIAHRFGLYSGQKNGKCHELTEPWTFPQGEAETGHFAPDGRDPFPFEFEPTFHRYRLEEPQHWKKPRTIFVCSMADLFGEWVPDEWIEAVFSVCKEAPQHRYLFLTKNPERYVKLAIDGKLPAAENMWYGTTTTTPEKQFFFHEAINTFVSVEPMQADFGEKFDGTMFPRWVIIGAETGNRSRKITPRREWIETLTRTAEEHGAAVFMKDSLIPIVGAENMRREFPW